MKPVWEFGEFMTGVIAFVFFPLGFNKTTLVTESFPPSQHNLMDGFDGPYMQQFHSNCLIEF